jgi:SNF2 family DNA or RNA helicase
MNADKKTKSAKKKKKIIIPYHQKPKHMSLNAWQKALRKQFAANNAFGIENIGSHPVYSDYAVFNPLTHNSYKISIRSNPKEIRKGINYNFCTCFDYKTNGLNTCKHIEAVMLYINKKRSLKKHFQYNFEPPYSSVYLRYTPEGRAVMVRINSEESEPFQQLISTYFNNDGTIKENGYEHFDVFLGKAKELNPSFRCYRDAMEFVVDIRERIKRKRWVYDHIEHLNNGMLKDYIKADLHPYQKEGVAFIIRSGRALIADDMGLGKTLQAIATAEILRKEFGLEYVLVVCPTSLKYQWKSEIEKFTDSTAIVIEGMHHKRVKQYFDDQNFYKIVSYNTIGFDLEQINKSEPGLIILDEAQRIKNWQTKTSKNIKKLESEYAIVLTGTPLENKLEELYSVVQFIDPFRLGALYRFLHDHQITESETNKVIGYKGLNQIGEILSDFLLRRKKSNVLKQLPSRQDKNLFVPMTKEQSIIHSECYDVVCRLVNRWRKLGFLPEKDRQRLMINLNMMRMSCDSTFILDQTTRHDTKINELMNVLEEIFAIEGEKVVIFSQWERMTRLVAKELDDIGIKYEYLHGGIPAKDRKDLLTNFQNDPESRVFLSTDAGGVGLNLQAAAYLINLDIPWNPAVLEQRIGRIYRMGQEKKVNVINFVSTYTIEHKMLSVLRFKSSMAEGVLDGGDDSIMMSDDRFGAFMKDLEGMMEAKPDLQDMPS